MNFIGLILVLGSLLSVGFLFCFNDRFRGEFGRAAWKWRLLIIVPMALYFAAACMMGFGTANKMVPGVLGMVLEIAVMMFSMIAQWVAMMWMMARPRIDWYMPGEQMDELTWDDYVGNDEIRARFQDFMDFISDPKKYAAHGAKLPKGILMLGEPGVGKTYLARIIANQTGVPIAICESSSMQSPFMAVGAMMVKSLYKKLRKLALQYGAAIVFFDEIDAIGLSRSGGRGGMAGGGAGMGGMGMFGGGSGILNALLGCMDGINSNEGFFAKLLRRYNLVNRSKRPPAANVITIGATNAPIEALDSALVREGRFDWKIYVTVSGDKGRKEQINYFLRKRKIDETVDIDRLVNDLRGQTPVAIDAVFNSAMIRAIRDKRDTIGYDDILFSLWDRDFGLPSPIALGELDEERVSKHEAGHALFAVILPMSSWRCWGATIVPRDRALGMVMSKPFQEQHTMVDEDFARQLLLCLGSRAVEEVCMKMRMSGFSGDLRAATSTAVAMIASFGMGEKLISYEALGMTASPYVVHEAELINRAGLAVAKKIVSENLEAVEALAAALLAKKNLDGLAVEMIVKKFATLKPGADYSALTLILEEVKNLKAEEKRKRREEAREAKLEEEQSGGEA